MSMTKTNRSICTTQLNWIQRWTCSYSSTTTERCCQIQFNYKFFHEICDITRYFTFTVYVGFIAGIIFFVLSLRKFTLRYQFHQLGWTLLTVLLIVMQSCAHVSNVYSGFVWFLASTTLVITNDIFAYIVGMKFGTVQFFFTFCQRKR